MVDTNKKDLSLLYKLYDIIHSREGLWEDVAEFTGNLDYFLIDDTYEKMLSIVNFIEGKVGETEETIQFKALIASLTRQSPQLVAIPAAER